MVQIEIKFALWEDTEMYNQRRILINCELHFKCENVTNKKKQKSRLFDQMSTYIWQIVKSFVNNAYIKAIKESVKL